MLESPVERRVGTTRHQRRWPARIFPVNFVVQHRTVLFRTAEGTKLVSAAINNRVLFEADDHNVAEAGA